MTGLRHLWRHRRLSLIAFAIAVALALFFSMRLALAAIYWSDPEHLRQQPGPWMTPGYIARSWEISPKEVAEALGLDPRAPPRGRTIEDIAAAQGRPVGDVIDDLADFLAAARP